MRASFIHIESWLRRVLKEDIRGDLAEFGVWYATTFMPMAELARMYQRKIHAVDSFVGMGEPGDRDDGQYIKGGLSVGGSKIFRQLAAPYVGTVVIHEGWVPDILQEMDCDTFSFVHLDLDHYQPMLDALRFVWPRMARGGIVCCHDWMRDRDILAAGAIKDWMRDSKVELEAENIQSLHAIFCKR